MIFSDFKKGFIKLIKNFMIYIRIGCLARIYLLIRVNIYKNNCCN